MAEFLKLRSLSESLITFLGAIPDSAISTVLTKETVSACGFVNAENIAASEDSPPFARSTVDGYAVRAKDTFGSSDSIPTYLKVVGEVLMGVACSLKLQGQETVLIHTGGMLPEEADAVVMLENTRLASAEQVEVFKAVSAYENTIRKGEDLKSGDRILAAGHRLRPVEIGGLLSQGIITVNVHKKPVFGIISSGDELVPPDRNIHIGQIRDINSHILAVLLDQNNAEYKNYGIVCDDRETLRGILQKAHAECDAVIVTAGSSISSRDITVELIRELGVPGVMVHGINIKPGKPTILAVCDGKPVIGLPGNPISAFVIASLIVIPLIDKMSGIQFPVLKPTVTAMLNANIPSQSGRLDYVPVSLSRQEEGLIATPIFFKSNLIFNLVKADGLIKIAEDVTGLESGSHVEVLPI